MVPDHHSAVRWPEQPVIRLAVSVTRRCSHLRLLAQPLHTGEDDADGDDRSANRPVVSNVEMTRTISGVSLRLSCRTDR